MAAWRQLTVRDIPGLVRVANEVHADLPESSHVFAERVKLFPEGCLTLVDGKEVCGYAISHPIRDGRPPPLDSLLGEIPRDADQYYIHDIALLSRLRGHGLAAKAIEQLLILVRSYTTTCLVSVYGTAPFWNRFGFVFHSVDAVLLEKLRNYGEDATFLCRRNGAVQEG